LTTGEKVKKLRLVARTLVAFLTAIAIAQRQRRAASSCVRRSHWRSSISQSVAKPTPIPCSRPHSKGLHQRRNSRRSLKRNRSSRRLSKPTRSAAARQRRLKLQTDYGQAVMWSKGFLADETKVAFARARELTAGADNSAERFIAYYAQWAEQLSQAELGFAQKTAETFRRQAENEGRATELVVGLRTRLDVHFPGRLPDGASTS
jgi:hypothetical protein